MEQIRSFIAIELTAELKSALARLQARLRPAAQAPVKWVDPNSIHLTLKFLGNISRDKTGELTAAIEDAARGIPPLQLEVKGLGVFPNPRRVQVAWVGLSGDIDRLCQLQRRIESSIMRFGFAPESRPFTAHLTLARLRDGASPDERQRFGQLITETSFEEVYNLYVDSVNLMRSQLTREGAIYSRISSVRLKGGPLSTTAV